jgi:hypothetical protein
MMLGNTDETSNYWFPIIDCLVAHVSILHQDLEKANGYFHHFAGSAKTRF